MPTSESVSGQMQLRLSAILLVLVAAALWVGPFLLRPDLFDGDAAHHIFWLYRYVDPALFPADVTVEYFRTSAPIGYRALYASLAPVLDPMLASKLVSGVLFLVCGWLAWLMGAAITEDDREWGGLLAALGLTLILALSLQTDSLAPMGMQRAFGLPLTMLCLWGLIAGRYPAVGVSWVLAGLFYPVLLPVLGIGAGVVFLRDMIRERWLPRDWIFNGVCAVAALALALFGTPKAPELGPVATYAQAITMPEFGAGGRLDLWSPGGMTAMFWHGMTGLGWAPRVIAGLVAAVVLVCVLGQRRLLPFAAWSLLLTGLAFWLALRVFPEQLMFDLYLPNRHSRWVIVCFGGLVIAALLQALLRFAAGSGATRRTRSWVAVAAPLVAVLALSPQAYAQWSRPVDRDLQKLQAFLGSLPSDTVIAAHPDLANYIPLYTRRSVLASTETSMPWMLGYFAQVKPRVEASLRAAYATQMDDVDRILQPYGVRVMITGPPVWTRVGYLEPYDAEVRTLQTAGSETGFALKAPPAERILFSSGEYMAVAVGAK